MSETTRARLLLGGAIVLSLLGLSLVWGQLQQFRPGTKAPPQQANPVICVDCGHRDRQTTQRLPLTCARCRLPAVHLAGICPKCGVWTAWDLAREKELVAQPGLFVQRGPAYFFPACAECGTPTNAAGQAPAGHAP